MTEDFKLRKIITLNYFVFYYLTVLFFFISHKLLSQVGPQFFSFNRDLTELGIIASGLPKFMIQHPVSFLIADSCLIILPLLIIFDFLRKKTFSWFPGSLLPIVVGLYILLQNIFTQQHPEMLIGLFAMAFCFTTSKQERLYKILSVCRYLFLYIFTSAAIWKIARGAIFNVEEFSNILIQQHADILTVPVQTALGKYYFFLINHPGVSLSLYIGAVVLELYFIIGFFTTRKDHLLLALSILFFIADYFLMRIPFWPLLVLGVTLTKFINKNIRLIPLLQLK